MSFGGSAAAMAQSVRDNRALRRKRNGLFDRDPGSGWAGVGEKRTLEQAPTQVRERFRAQLEEERLRDQLWLYGQVFLIVGLLAALAYFL